VAGALLVAHQDVLDRVLLENLVIDRQHRSARISEDMLDALSFSACITISAPVSFPKKAQLPINPAVRWWHRWITGKP
jgi:hypothetical protein